MVIHFMRLTVVLLSSLVVSLTCTLSNTIQQQKPATKKPSCLEEGFQLYFCYTQKFKHLPHLSRSSLFPLYASLLFSSRMRK